LDEVSQIRYEIRSGLRVSRVTLCYGEEQFPVELTIDTPGAKTPDLSTSPTTI
jgi:hypothetical protein